MCIAGQLRWSRGGVLAFSTQVRGFKPGRSHRIFKGEKILSTPSFRGEVKPSVPCRRFAACKRSLNVAWKSTFRQNYQTILAHKFHLSLLGSLASTWGHLVAEVGTSKKIGGYSGLHNKPAGCSASEAYAPGPDGEEEEECALLYDQPRPPIVMPPSSQCHYLICKRNIGLYSEVLVPFWK